MFKGSREFLFPTSISFKKFLWTFRFLSLILRDSGIFFLRNFARKIGKQRARFDPLAYARRLTTVLTVRIFRKGQEKEQDTTYILQETEVNCVDRKNIQERAGKGTGFYIHTTGNGSHIRIFFRVFFLLITVISTFIAAIALTLELVPMACCYCLPPVLNGHLKQNYSNKTKNNT